MIDRTCLTYCLACHRVMPQPEQICPRCGADQQEVRARLLEPRRPVMRGRFGRPKMPPPLPLNALETAPCPTCKVPVPAGAPSCTYCGHMMLTDLPRYLTDDQMARRYGFLAILFIIIGAVAAPFSLFALCLCTVAAVLCGFFGFAENPFGWSSTLLMAAVTTLGMLVVAALFATAFLNAG